MRKLLMTTVATLVLAGSANAEPFFYKKMFEFLWTLPPNTMYCGQGPRAIYCASTPAYARVNFDCDYTSHTCERWVSPHPDWRVYELISDYDRRTVIGHGACGYGVCVDLETGEVTGWERQLAGFHAWINGPDGRRYPFPGPYATTPYYMGADEDLN